MSYLSDSILLLEEIKVSPEKKAWCRDYSVYSFDDHQPGLIQRIEDLVHQAYENNLIITNYSKVIDYYGHDKNEIEKAAIEWLSALSYEGLLACIAYHFRRDHFCEGALINESIASGALLRMFRQLSSFDECELSATTIETLYKNDCSGVPEKPGVYWVIVPDGFQVEFVDHIQNEAAKPYPVEVLRDKYSSCNDKRTIYIGKASGKRGLKQRLRQYMKYGWNEASNHKGGRAIWQIDNTDMLLIMYKCCTDSIEQEHRLIKEYRDENDSYPLANWRA